MIYIKVDIEKNKYIKKREVQKIYSDILKIFLNLCPKVKQNFTKNVFLSVNFINSHEMVELNKRYRELEETTDIISLGYLSRPLESNHEEKIEFLGEIFIDYDYLVKDHISSLYKNFSIHAYLKFIFVHGFLHLLGYDHQNTEDEKQMNKIQDKIWKTILKNS